MSKFTDIPPPVFVPVEQELCKVDRVFDTVEIRREKIYQILEESLHDIKLTPNGDPEQLEAQTKLLDTALKTLAEMEKASLNRANLKMKMKDTEDGNELNNGIAELLRMVDMRNQNGLSNITFTPEEQESMINSQFADRGCVVISEGEMSASAEDVHVLSAVLKQEELEAKNNTGK